MIDCHILINSERAHWHDQCFASLEGHPIVLHHLPAQATVSQGRRLGFTLGQQPYVSFVDDDDKVLPNAFAYCLQALEACKHAVAAYTSEEHIDAIGGVLCQHPPLHEPWSYEAQRDRHPYVHHIVVMRRCLVEPLLYLFDRYPTVGDQALLLALGQLGPFLHIPIAGYQWRRHDTQVTWASETIKAEWQQVLQDEAELIPKELYERLRHFTQL